MHIRSFAACVLGCTVVATSNVQAESYGFGTFMPKRVKLVRRLAPEVQLSNVSIDVKFPNGSGCLDQNRFKSDLLSQIAQGGKNIFLDEKRPMYEIRLNVTACDRPHVERKTSGKNTSYTALGSASVVMQLVRMPDGHVELSGTESYSAGQDEATVLNRPMLGGLVNLGGAGGSANENTTDDSVAAEITQHLALRIASHLVITPDPVTITLAKGPDLDEANKLAMAGRWSEYLEKLSTMTARPAAADDAYRLYDMGIANEALGYASDDSKTTLKYLDEASIDYSKAKEAKEGEKNFVEAQGRIERALARYTVMKTREAEDKKDQEKQRADAAAYAEKKRSGAIDNLDVVRLVQAHIAEDIIITRIRTAPKADFDLSTDGLVVLSQNGVNGNVLNTMMARMKTPDTPMTDAPAQPAPKPARRR